jgi:glucokinase
MLLVGDIGGTNTRLALVSDDAKKVVRQAVLPSAEHRSLGSAIDVFFAQEKKTPKIHAATFGIAGPVIDGRVKTTNLPWVVDERVLSRALRVKRVTLLNDLVALALGAVAAKPKDVHLLQGDRLPRTGAGNVAVIAAGTGLGEAALIWDGERLVPCGTEGGHADFAPRNDLEWQLFKFLSKRIGGRVSVERVLSGPGLGALYDFFVADQKVGDTDANTRALATADDRNAAIARLGGAEGSEPASRALDLFATLYGAEAGNLALKTLAVGGVFVAGKIAASITPRLDGSFVPAFVDKGRFGPLLAGITVAVVKRSDIGLVGSARHAAGLV